MPYFVGFYYNDDYPAKRNKIDLWNKKMYLRGARKHYSIRHWRKKYSDRRLTKSAMLDIACCR